jgi:tetratricopeptide (TPR) repeat protein
MKCSQRFPAIALFPVYLLLALPVPAALAERASSGARVESTPTAGVTPVQPQAPSPAPIQTVPTAAGSAQPDQAPVAPSETTEAKPELDKAQTIEAESGKTPSDKTPSNKTPSDKTPSDQAPSGQTTSNQAPPDPGPPAKTPEELARFQKLAAADALYREGKLAEAAALYRQAKASKVASEPALGQTPEGDRPAPALTETPVSPPVAPILTADQLSVAGQVYWREAQAGIAQKLESRTMVPLRLLVEKHPEFIPGSLTLAQQLEDAGQPEAAAQILDRLSGQFPDQPDVLRSRLALLAKTEQWMEASIAARQYALLYPNAPAAQEFGQSADDYLKRYQKQVRSKITGNLIGGIVTGALGYAVTGNIWGPLSSVQTSLLLLRGESAVGDRYARQVQRRLEMVKDEAILSYVNEVGQKLAQVSGRSEFKYEFHVILDDRLNAFALPGGKVFINAGAITKAASEAELAGLLAHELSHAVLSHGFQIVTSGSFTANVFQFVPLGGLATDLIVLGYSRKMERQADTLGTRLLAASGYAADGLRNLMVTLGREDKAPPALGILSSHPENQTRVNYIEALITQGGYNRYAYEGVERHAQIQARVQKLLDEKKAQEEKEQEGHKRRRNRRQRSQ